MSLKLSNFINKCLTPFNLSSRSFAFKSDLSLDKIYPNSVIIKPFSPPQNQDGKFSGYIPIGDLNITYSKSSGPGGQYAHKTKTKVDIRFHVKTAKWLNEETKSKLLEKCVTRINKDGYFVIKSEKTREALTNTLDAMSKIREIIYKLEDPNLTISETTAEKLRKQKEKAVRERLIEKRKISLKKRERRGEIE